MHSEEIFKELEHVKRELEHPSAQLRDLVLLAAILTRVTPLEVFNDPSSVGTILLTSAREVFSIKLDPSSGKALVAQELITSSA